ncbi:MAG: hypothetical protein FWG68_00260 [Defluviitaleaceae bacterium]|nr:hypothetical protein [Defluviitaleaceae bacterium]
MKDLGVRYSDFWLLEVLDEYFWRSGFENYQIAKSRKLLVYGILGLAVVLVLLASGELLLFL